MEQKKVDFLPRFLAAVIDGVIGGILAFVLPVIGVLLSVAYILLKDGVMYQITKDDQWRNKSIGKKIMNLRVISLDGATVDMAVSAKRNIPLAIGSAIAVIPIIGWVLGPIVAVVFAIIELVLFMTDEKGQRFGDRWANTQVINDSAVVSEEDTVEVDTINKVDEEEDKEV